MNDIDEKIKDAERALKAMLFVYAGIVLAMLGIGGVFVWAFIRLVLKNT
jgi:hypothetical protein